MLSVPGPSFYSRFLFRQFFSRFLTVVQQSRAAGPGEPAWRRYTSGPPARVGNEPARARKSCKNLIKHCISSHFSVISVSMTMCTSARPARRDRPPPTKDQLHRAFGTGLLIIHQIRPAPQIVSRKSHNQNPVINNQISDPPGKAPAIKMYFAIKILFLNQNPFLNQTRIPILARTYTSSGPFWDPIIAKILKKRQVL